MSRKKVQGKCQGPIYTMGPFTDSDRAGTKSFWRDGVNVRLSIGELATSLFKQELDSRCIHKVRKIVDSFSKEFKEESLPKRVVAGLPCRNWRCKNAIKTTRTQCLSRVCVMC